MAKKIHMLIRKKLIKFQGWSLLWPINNFIDSVKLLKLTCKKSFENIDEISWYLYAVSLCIVINSNFISSKSNVFIITYKISGKSITNTIAKEIIACFNDICFFINNTINNGITNTGKKKYEVPVCISRKCKYYKTNI